MPAERRWRARLGSVRVRVTAGALVVMTVALVVGALLLVGLLRRELRAELDTSLQTRVKDLTASAVAGSLPDPVPVLSEETGIVQVVDEAGTVLAATPGLGAAPVLPRGAPPAPGASRTYEVADLPSADRDEDRFRVLATTTATPSGTVTVYAASSLSRLDEQAQRFALLLFLGLPVLLALIGGLTWWVVGRALRPVERLRSEVEQIQAHHLDRRVVEPSLHDEVGRLARTMNGLLARLDRAASSQRRFAADASHELRSPVTAARTELEVALAYPDRADWPATAQDVLSELDRLEVLARDLLVLTRVDATRRLVATAAVDLAALVRGEVERPGASSVPVLALRSPDRVLVTGDESLLTRLVRNLLDNARRHAASRVDVVLEGSRDGTVLLEVANDGPPIPAADRERVFEPFTRLDEARAADDGGAGLGLAIVRDIALAHGGTARVADVPTGTTFVVTLPAAP